MNAAFCCASLGIVPTVRHADYIGSWLEVLREDNRAIVRAASQASKAADWLLAFLPDAEPASDEDETRSEEHTSELQSLMRISYAVFCLTIKSDLAQPTHPKSTRLTPTH